MDYLEEQKKKYRVPSILRKRTKLGPFNRVPTGRLSAQSGESSNNDSINETLLEKLQNLTDFHLNPVAFMNQKYSIDSLNRKQPSNEDDSLKKLKTDMDTLQSNFHKK